MAFTLAPRLCCVVGVERCWCAFVDVCRSDKWMVRLGLAGAWTAQAADDILSPDCLAGCLTLGRAAGPQGM